MNISDDLLCLYSARVTEQGDTYTIEVPKREVQQGNVLSGETYRVALISSEIDESASGSMTQDEATVEGNSQSRSRDAQTDPPVSEGEMREVEIESFGDKGDGITKIDGGYVVIVPDTEVGEQVTIRLDDVRENVGFAEVVKRKYHRIDSKPQDMTGRTFECKYCGREISFQETDEITTHLANNHEEIIREEYSIPDTPWDFRGCQRQNCEGHLQEDAYCDKNAHDNLRVIIGSQAGIGAYGSITKQDDTA